MSKIDKIKIVLDNIIIDEESGEVISADLQDVSFNRNATTGTPRFLETFEYIDFYSLWKDACFSYFSGIENNQETCSVSDLFMNMSSSALSQVGSENVMDSLFYNMSVLTHGLFIDLEIMVQFCDHVEGYLYKEIDVSVDGVVNFYQFLEAFANGVDFVRPDLDAVSDAEVVTGLRQKITLGAVLSPLAFFLRRVAQWNGMDVRQAGKPKEWGAGGTGPDDAPWSMP